MLMFIFYLYNEKVLFKVFFCLNPSLGLATKVRACKSVGQEGSPGGTSYTPGSARKCERMSPHTSK